ncbi:ribonuclease T2-like [Phlyctochytrium bullatum]|nr:ribonuclease T2-like [Phlyctochytrium bullatum]
MHFLTAVAALGLAITAVSAIAPGTPLFALRSDRLAAGYPNSCPAEASSCDRGTASGDCCVPKHGKMVLALQWLPGYCVGMKDTCRHDTMDRLPKEEWTIHGLWPNTCSNAQVGYCDKSREVEDVEDRMKNTTLYDGLKKYCHEWNRHGQCYSPADPQCLAKNETDLEVFFDTVLKLQNRYNIYKALAENDILPDPKRTYTSQEIKLALAEAFGPSPITIALRCKGAYLSEIRLALVGARPGLAKNGVQGLPSSCPRKGVRYVPGHEHGNGVRKEDAKLVFQDSGDD